jgi:thiol-disulfide isomerase/thioredoxin
MMKKALFASAITSTLLLTSCSGGGTSSPNENAFVSGDGVAVYVQPAKRVQAPNLSGPTLDGGKFVSPKKVTVVNVWASWCSPCRAEAPLLEDFATKRTEIQFVGILTRDNTSSAQSFVRRFKITYPILTDDSVLASFRNSLVPNAIPTTLLIDVHGRVAARISGQVTYALLDNMITKVVQNA